MKWLVLFSLLVACGGDSPERTTTPTDETYTTGDEEESE